MDIIERKILEMNEKKTKGCYFINKRSTYRILCQNADFIPIVHLPTKEAKLLIKVFGDGCLGQFWNVPIVFNRNRKGFFEQEW